MKKSVIFFAIFLLVLALAVITERREREDFTKDVVMGEKTTVQNLDPNLDMELP